MVRHRGQMEMRDTGSSFQRIVERAPDVIIILGPDLSVRYVSPSVRRMLGREPYEVVGTALLPYLHLEEREWARGFLLENQDGSKEAPTPVELRMCHADGSWRRFEVVGVDLLDDPDVEGIALYMHDVTEERALRDELAHRSFHDSLTGLPNRALFMNRLEHALARAARHRGPVTVLFVDLDDFKAVNDSFGHEVGDTLLVAIGQRLQACVRPGDTVARFGGDEFAILLEHTADPYGATRAVERVMQASREPVAVRGRRLFVTASIGAATGEPGEGGAEDVLRRADMAMYRAKRGGKAHFELFEEGASEIAHERLCLEDDLKGALERGELRLHYQPGVALATGGIIGMEALLRWEYHRRSEVSIEEIVALAEMSGLIAPIGRWVLEEACRQALLWQDRYPDHPPTVSVNLSAKQFRQPTLAEEVAGTLERIGLDPRNLALEVKGLSIDDTPHLITTVEKLKGLGVGLVIDDFGTGRSSLSYLERFPVEMLKIDRQFVGELGRGEAGSAKLVSAMVEFARAMDVLTLAEGVETADQMEKLREMGCDLAQGFYFWKPLPGDAATELLDSDRKS